MTEQRNLSPLQRALDATAFASHWKTWPTSATVAEVHTALAAALEAASEQPDLKRFDLAKVAVEAAKGDE